MAKYPNLNCSSAFLCWSLCIASKPADNKAPLSKSGRTGHCKPSWYSWASLPHCCQPLVPSSWIMLSPWLTPSALSLFWIAGKFFPLLVTSNIAVSSTARATRLWLISLFSFQNCVFLQCSCKAVGVKIANVQGKMVGSLYPLLPFSPQYSFFWDFSLRYLCFYLQLCSLRPLWVYFYIHFMFTMCQVLLFIVQSLNCVPTLATINCSTPGFLVLHLSWSLLETVHWAGMSANHLILVGETKGYKGDICDLKFTSLNTGISTCTLV